MPKQRVSGLDKVNIAINTITDEKFAKAMLGHVKPYVGHWEEGVDYMPASCGAMLLDPQTAQ